MAAGAMGNLVLGIRDAQDLEVVSALLQDAVCKIGDMSYQPGRRQFALVVNRFDWFDAGSKPRLHGPYQRVRTGLHFNDVIAVKSQNIRQKNEQGVVSLLAVQFEADEAPGGTVSLTLSGGGSVLLEVGCLDGGLSDMGLIARTAQKPFHGAAFEASA